MLKVKLKPFTLPFKEKLFVFNKIQYFLYFIINFFQWS